MESVIDGGVAVGLLVPVVECLAQRFALVLHGEVDDGGGAAVRGGARAGLEGVGGGRAAEGELHVRVGVDAAGDDQPAFGVDDFVRVGGDRFGDHGDLPVLDQDVGVVVVDCGDNPAVLDDGAHGGEF